MSSLLTQTVKTIFSPWCTLLHSGQNRDRFVVQRSILFLPIRLCLSELHHGFLVLDLRHFHYLRAYCMLEGQSIRNHVFFSKRVQLTGRRVDDG
jgi:hypothetical protein